MAYQFKNSSILVVDDMLPMLSLVSSLLKIFGFTNIYLAHDAEEGFKSFCRYNQDIVLTDWLMEPYDGIELTRMIRNEEKSPNRFVPIVMMTGFSHRIRVEEARDIGVTEFLVKPFRARDMYARIEQLIERPRKFVEADEFFGPDRRRRKMMDYQGSQRREIDASLPDTEEGERMEAILKKLTEEAKRGN